MVLKIYGVKISATTHLPLVVAKELGVPYELIDVDMSTIKSQAYISEMHPFGRIPTAFDDGVRVIESRAIARYLAARYSEKGSKLVPPTTDPIAYARFEEAASIESGDFDGPAGAIMFERYFKSHLGMGEPDEAVVEKSIQKFKTVLDAYDIILSKQKYIGGDNLTLIDFFHLPRGEFLGKVGVDLLTSYKPNVTRWWKEISELESWKAVRADIPY